MFEEIVDKVIKLFLFNVISKNHCNITLKESSEFGQTKFNARQQCRLRLLCTPEVPSSDTMI